MRSRIAFKLAAIWLAVAVPLVLILAGSFIERYQSRVSLIEQERVGYARLSAIAFRSIIQDAALTMIVLAPAVDHDPVAGRMILQRAAREYPASYLVLTDENGIVRASSDSALVGNDYSSLASFKAALSAKGGFGIEPSSNFGGKRPGIHIAQRVTVKGNRPFGVMIMRIDVQRLHDEYPLSVPSGGISIIDSAGQVVFQNEKKSFALNRDQWGDRFWFVRNALKGKESPTANFSFPGGERRIGAFVPVEPFGWAAGSSLDADTALAPYWRSVAVTFPMIFGAVALGFLLSVYVAERIRRSLQRLATDAATIGDGDFSRPVDVSRSDEIGVVALTLEKARQDLAHYEQENQALFDRQQEISDLNAALAAINASLHSSLDFEHVLSLVLEASVRAIGCEAAGVNLREDESWVRVALVGLPEKFIGERLRDEQNTVAALVHDTQKPVIINDAASDPRIDAAFVAKYGIKSVMTFPLILRGEVFGVVFFNELGEVREFSAAQIDFASSLSNSLSLAYENARLYQTEHIIAEKLQADLLEAPGSIEGIDYSVRYQSASDVARVGGDFYDLLVLEDGRIGITIGDIAGHGIDAAVHTSLIRTAIRVRASDSDATPADVLETVNRVFLGSSASEEFATVFFGYLDPNTGELEYSNGGHTSGAVLSFDRVRMLPANSPLVGAFREAEFENSSARLAEDEMLFLYTDGLIEARGPFDLYGEARLVQVLKRSWGQSPLALSSSVFDDVQSFSAGCLSDDLAIVVLKRAPYGVSGGDDSAANGGADGSADSGADPEA